MGEVDAGVEHRDLHAGAVEARSPHLVGAEVLGGLGEAAGRRRGLRRVVAGHRAHGDDAGGGGELVDLGGVDRDRHRVHRLGDTPLLAPSEGAGPVDDAVLLVLHPRQLGLLGGGVGDLTGGQRVLGQRAGEGRLGQAHDHLDRPAGAPQALVDLHGRQVERGGVRRALRGGCSRPASSEQTRGAGQAGDQQADAVTSHVSSLLPRGSPPGGDNATSRSSAQGEERDIPHRPRAGGALT